MTTLQLKIQQTEKRIRVWIWLFIAGLVLSGLTAFPLEWELSILQKMASAYLAEENALRFWIMNVYQGVRETNIRYPFMAYGTDWLAFAHLIIALSFWGPIKDPVRNSWIIEFGIIACIMVFPLALIAGAVRDIPFYWRIIDCTFGVVGIIPLTYTYQQIRKLKKLRDENGKS